MSYWTETDVAMSAYDAYGAVTDHKNYQGLPMPAWKDLTPKIQEAWKAAVLKAMEMRSGYIPPSLR